MCNAIIPDTESACCFLFWHYRYNLPYQMNCLFLVLDFAKCISPPQKQNKATYCWKNTVKVLPAII